MKRSSPSYIDWLSLLLAIIAIPIALHGVVCGSLSEIGFAWFLLWTDTAWLTRVEDRVRMRKQMAAALYPWDVNYSKYEGIDQYHG